MYAKDKMSSLSYFESDMKTVKVHFQIKVNRKITGIRVIVSLINLKVAFEILSFSKF
jgi:hypothetical protein